MSTIRVNAVQNTSGVEQYLAKAWVNFNGTGTVSVRASGNVTNITDNGVGDYTINITNALADASYAVVGTCQHITANNNTAVSIWESTTPTVSAVRVRAATNGGVNDPAIVNVVIFR